MVLHSPFWTNKVHLAEFKCLNESYHEGFLKSLQVLDVESCLKFNPRQSTVDK